MSGLILKLKYGGISTVTTKHRYIFSLVYICITSLCCNLKYFRAFYKYLQVWAADDMVVLIIAQVCKYQNRGMYFSVSGDCSELFWTLSFLENGLLGFFFQCCCYIKKKYICNTTVFSLSKLKMYIEAGKSKQIQIYIQQGLSIWLTVPKPLSWRSGFISGVTSRFLWSS